MARRWLWCLAAVLAATVLGGLMPHSVLSAPDGLAPSTITLRAEEPPVAPSGCLDASCGRGAPAAPTPALTIAAVAAVLAGVAALAALRTTKRPRLATVALPRGTVLALFRPPQFS
jgi:hypothetical protein